MKFKTSELTGGNLNRAVALAIGRGNDGSNYNENGTSTEYSTSYNPVHTWRQCGELIDKFNISLTFEEDGLWSATCYDENTNEGEDVGLGETAQQAICRCVVSKVYGDEVEL